MPKFYIQDDSQGWIVDGKNPLHACVKGLYFGFIASIPIDPDTHKIKGAYLVSEKGFDDESGDIIPIKKAVTLCLKLKD
jgi:hypothetical protein